MKERSFASRKWIGNIYVCFQTDIDSIVESFDNNYFVQVHMITHSHHLRNEFRNAEQI